MALSFTNVLDKGTRSYKSQGRVVVIVDMTASAGSSDYSSGFDLASNASKMGLRKIEDVYGVYARSSANAPNVLHAFWNVATDKLQFYVTVAGTGATEVTNQFSAGDIIRFVATGV